MGLCPFARTAWIRLRRKRKDIGRKSLNLRPAPGSSCQPLMVYRWYIVFFPSLRSPNHNLDPPPAPKFGIWRSLSIPLSAEFLRAPGIFGCAIRVSFLDVYGYSVGS